MLSNYLYAISLLCILLLFNSVKTFIKISIHESDDFKDIKLFLTSLIMVNTVLMFIALILQIVGPQYFETLISFRLASLLLLVLILNTTLVLLRRV